MEDLSHMLKAIHASEDGEAAREKATQIGEKLEAFQRLQVAKLIREPIHETLTYDDPDTHWRRIRTNNPLERLIKEVRR